MKRQHFIALPIVLLVLAMAPVAARAEAAPAASPAAELAAKVAPNAVSAANTAAATANAPSSTAAEAGKVIGSPAGEKNPAAPAAGTTPVAAAPAPGAPAAAAPAGTTPAATPAGTPPTGDAASQVVGTTPEGVKVEPAFRYDASLPDPFVPYAEPILKCLGAGETPPPGYVPPEECGDEIKEPLEMFDLNQLQVLGIIWGIRDSRAKIRDPEGNYWTVRVGQKIGKNRGRIKAIREGEIEVEERFWDENLRAYQKIMSTMSLSSK